ncbi:MAG: ABC transporter permease subunit [Clostridia bacterium]|nr:ABC transporter permease subunit [Clostridia bacterium]
MKNHPNKSKLPAWLKKPLLYAAAVAVWVLVWYLAARRIGEELLLPRPGAVVRRLAELTVTAGFRRVVLTSLGRIAAGMVIGVTTGCLLALLTHFVPPLYTLFHPVITVIRSTPVASFIILIYLWIGRDLLPGFVSVLLVLPVVWANLHEALGAVDPDLLEMARLFRLPLRKRITRVYLPSVMPSFMAACRTSVGLSWKAGIAAEVLVVPALSIGRHLADAKLYMETVDLFAWTLAVVLLSLLLELTITLLFSRFEKRRGQRTERSAHE